MEIIIFGDKRLIAAAVDSKQAVCSCSFSSPYNKFKVFTIKKQKKLKQKITFNSAGVIFRPLLLKNANGQKLYTKQLVKKLSANGPQSS